MKSPFASQARQATARSAGMAHCPRQQHGEKSQFAAQQMPSTSKTSTTTHASGRQIERIKDAVWNYVLDSFKYEQDLNIFSTLLRIILQLLRRHRQLSVDTE